MGNCFAVRGDLVTDSESTVLAEAASTKKQAVKFTVNGGGAGAEAKNAIRVRIVVTPEELDQILKHGGGGSIEQLLDAMRTKGRIVARMQNGGGGWRPGLESIPEES